MNKLNLPKYFKKYAFIYLIALLAMTASTFLDQMAPLVVQHIVDDVEHHQHCENQGICAKDRNRQRDTQKAIIGKHRAKAQHSPCFFVLLHFRQWDRNKKHSQNHHHPECDYSYGEDDFDQIKVIYSFFHRIYSWGI